MSRKMNREEAAQGLRGFTLIELLIAMAVTAFVISSLILIFVSQQRSYTQQTEIARSQANARGALFAMARDIRMAGYSGIPLGFDELALQGLAYPIISPEINNPAADQETIEIYGNFSRRATTLLAGGTPSPIFAGDEDLRVVNPSIFQGAGVNRPLWVMVGDNNRTVELHRIASVSNDGTITLESGESFSNDFGADETIVAPVFRRKFWVGADNILWMRNCDTTDPADGCPSGSEVRLATGIDSIRFSYDVAANPMGTAINTGQAKSCDPCSIRSVNINLWTRTENKYDPNKVIRLESGTSTKVRNIGYETTSCPIAGCN